MHATEVALIDVGLSCLTYQIYYRERNLFGGMKIKIVVACKVIRAFYVLKAIKNSKLLFGVQ